MSDPLATPTDLGVYLNKEIPADDPRATMLLQFAHDRVESYIDPVPQAAKSIELSVAARAYTNATNAHQVALGSGNVSFGAQNSMTGIGGLYVSSQEQRDLRRMGGGSGAFSVDLLQGWPLGCDDDSDDDDSGTTTDDMVNNDDGTWTYGPQVAP